MTEQLVIPAAVALERVQAVERAAAAAANHVRDPHAARTTRAYAVQWAAWERYTREREIDPVPIDPRELVTYLQLRTDEGAAPNYVRLALAALCSYDQLARVTLGLSPRPLRSEPIVARWLRGWSRANPRRPRRQAPAITARELEQVLLAAAERPPGASRAQHIALYARDRAMLVLGVTAALRVSELVELDVGDVSIGDRGLRVLVRRSKVDQHGEGKWKGCWPQARVIRCPVDAWRCWLAVRGTADGPAFHPFDRSGLAGYRLHERSARRIVARRGAAVGLELLSSHSLRASFATLAAEKGKALHKIAEQGDWKSLDVLRGYIRQGELFHDDNPSAGLLDD